MYNQRRDAVAQLRAGRRLGVGARARVVICLATRVWPNSAVQIQRRGHFFWCPGQMRMPVHVMLTPVRRAYVYLTRGHNAAHNTSEAACAFPNQEPKGRGLDNTIEAPCACPKEAQKRARYARGIPLHCRQALGSIIIRLALEGPKWHSGCHISTSGTMDSH